MQLTRETLAIPLLLVALVATGPPVLVIQNATVIDTRTGQVVANRTVMVEGDRIRRVVPANEAATPSYARVIDARGRWVLPGLIDMHVHGSSRPDVPLELYVANGVTSIRDLG